MNSIILLFRFQNTIGRNEEIKNFRKELTKINDGWNMRNSIYFDSNCSGFFSFKTSIL